MSQPSYSFKGPIQSWPSQLPWDASDSHMDVLEPSFGTSPTIAVELVKQSDKYEGLWDSTSQNRTQEWSSAMFGSLYRVFDRYDDDEDHTSVGISVSPALHSLITEHWIHSSQPEGHPLMSAMIGFLGPSFVSMKTEDCTNIDGWILSTNESTEKISKGLLLLPAIVGIPFSVKHLLKALDSVVTPFSQCLNQALSDLHTMDEYLEDDELLPPDALISNVERLLNQIYEEVELPVEIYPDPEGDVILSFSISPKDLVFIHCDIDGSAYCMVKISGERSNKSYNTIADLPDSFIMNALREFANSTR